MSCRIVCDTCGTYKPLGHSDSCGDKDCWYHDYETGTDQCPKCRAKCEAAWDLASYNRVRRAVGLPESTELPKALTPGVQ